MLPSPCCVNSNTSAALCDIVLTEEEVYSVLSTLDGSKASGPDGMALLRNALPLCPPLFHLFSLCIAQSYIPKAWAIYNITPVHISGDRACIGKELPPHFPAVQHLVGLVYNKISAHINGLISNSQFGFRKGTSTVF